jgi:hypothetical protein
MMNCQVTDCNNKPKAIGYCNAHYLQVSRCGKIRTTSREGRPARIEGDIAYIPLGVSAKDGYAKVDKAFAYLDSYKWRLHTTGYAIANDTPTTLIKMHHLIAGKPPKGQMTDHINGNRLDNTKSNLRFCTISQNGMNMSKPKHNTSGFKGVYWSKRNNKWAAKLNVNKKQVHIGFFTDKLDAAKAYNNKAQELFGQFAKINIMKV